MNLVHARTNKSSFSVSVFSFDFEKAKKFQTLHSEIGHNLYTDHSKVFVIVQLVLFDFGKSTLMKIITTQNGSQSSSTLSLQKRSCDQLILFEINDRETLINRTPPSTHPHPIINPPFPLCVPSLEFVHNARAGFRISSDESFRVI